VHGVIQARGQAPGEDNLDKIILMKANQSMAKSGTTSASSYNRCPCLLKTMCKVSAQSA